MAGSAGGRRGHDHVPAAPAATVDPFLEAKLRWPPPRESWVPRQRLLTRLGAVCDHPVTLAAAPAGYGKTTLLAQWLEAEHPRAAWVSLDPGDNDANRLWAHVAAALERAGCRLETGGPVDRTVGATTTPGSTLTAIVDALRAAPHDIVIVLDDFQYVQDARTHSQVEFLIAHLPPQAHLLISTRSDPGLRLGRLRASSDLLELRSDALGFTPHEAGLLLGRSDVELDPESFDLLMESTEGWPAGVYLASLSLEGRSAPSAVVRAFRDGNRFTADYLTEEVLGRHPSHVRDFITEVSLLERFTASLCDHVRGSSGSATILRDLERTNLFLTPLDHDGHWYRFHHLFAAVARTELEVSRPDDVATLHSRAAQWFTEAGHVDEAISHLIAAGDAPGAATLAQRHWLQYVDAGRVATVLGWSAALGPSPDGAPPAATVTAAWLAALIGDESTLEASLTALRDHRDHGPLPDGTRSVESATAMIEGLFGYGGPLTMRASAQRAATLETDRHSPFYALAQTALGHAYYVAGDLDRARVPLSEARHNDRAPSIIRSLSLATESLVEDELGHLEQSQEHAERAMEVLDANGLRAVPQASLAYTALGRARAAVGRVDDALVILGRGLELRRDTSAHGPWGMIHHLLVHAGVAAEAGETALATSLLGELESRTAAYADGMTAMHVRTEAVRRTLRSTHVGSLAGQELTEREMEILQLLQGSMSLRQIADELYLSSNTVKTHSRAVYRKLGAHTRAEAVTAARRQGLV
ncbi:LuxR C-terminal-related transcriptional regulator [Nocardioides sp. S-58]|uniref:LuxR C-terminal-related transcriptional regulator n=1 Tax=Nocardioides renjunii TaxID=3095075 RepID=A0ABU5K9V4_9ACTN|nr:LuxR C-terminal-related transcriptional regulator [Nocardioides sp. S-58]MDZ5661753.1 LuxR C-terminal-related transcriptional regulator [Nocardioides sp. S-58]